MTHSTCGRTYLPKTAFCLILIFLNLFVFTITVPAQQEIELVPESYAGSIPSGPTAASQTVSFRNNTTGNTFIIMTNPVSVTASLSNQQYTGLAGNAGAGVMFGSDFTNIYGNSPNVIGIPVFNRLDYVGSPSGTSYTSNPYGAAGSGISVSTNYGFSLLNTANMWIGTSGPSGNRAYYSDITFSFSRPVSDPVLHFSGMGAILPGNNYTTEFELPAGSGLTLTKLSGSSELVVPASGDKIINASSTPNSDCGSGAACGSVRVNGTNISSVTLRIYVRFRTSSFPSTFSGGSDGDLYIISLSLATFNLSGTVYNDANALNDNTVNGTVTNAGNQLYAIAVDDFGKVQGSTAVSAAGTFSFTNLVKGPYTVRLSASAGALGSIASSASLPSGWINTGEYRGTGAGSDGTADGNLADIILTSNVNNFNLGIERIPIANDIYYHLVEKPIINSVLALNGAIGSLPVGNAPTRPNGNDAEDGVLGAGNTLVINTLPANGTLLYNNIAVTAGQVIAGFNPALLMIRFNGAGYNGISFTYSYKDAATASSLPATYSIIWNGALPVTLLSFTVSKQADNNVLLKWETTNEHDNDRFGIQHSTDGINWQTIGFVNSAGNEQLRVPYSFLHTNVPAGQHYYRLQQFDIDARYTISPVRKTNIGLNSVMLVYPNPAKDRLYITWDDADQNWIEARIYNTSGLLMLQQKEIKNGVPLNIEQLAPGLYILTLNAAHGRTYQEKIIKQ